MMTSDDKFFNSPPPTPPHQFDRVEFTRFDSKRSDEELAESLDMLSASGEDSNPSAAPADVPKPIQVSFPQPAKNGRSYKCSVCGKVFSSYQALGGHKTSHRVKLPSNVVTATKNNNSSAVATASDESAPDASRKLHECSICQKTFTSGQALGGHKSLHYDRTRAKSVVTSSNNGSTATNSHVNEDGDSQTTPVLRDFDLNQSPPPSSPELDLTLKLG